MENEEKKFQMLAKKWKEATLFTSSMTEIIDNMSYREIIDMGKDALSFIFDDLKKNGGHWFFALRQITGDDPVRPEDHGHYEKMRSFWLDWAERNGYNVDANKKRDDCFA